MPTLKQRISLSVPDDVGNVLTRLAKRDQTTVSTKALDLVRFALEIEEDMALGALAQARDGKKAKFVAHDAAWA
ncbi:hypothetical protein A2856_00710 [Candidatus Uhrbacteria bacterium RIFCSPHIGHO2_01_FULL_63_20]|uniref:CopG-like ribbon-helix-helix domain-containing protein n=1 Tax=Candidatus Uhrbacteria bacterium RIFCSPHIGHO2_01_FULL_63_20 TaxID=1802385 RepID=A0A1F7TLY9_9BACT|nr:MAG: hypothetical protein A2856_00710 [Candidatus Uhrbacteria bacterium RIFCSPHIGHO2_01_FULL_63_20]